MTSIKNMSDDKLAAWIDMMNDDGEVAAALEGIDELKTRQEWERTEEQAMLHERIECNYWRDMAGAARLP